jgi:hypothetical protein
VTTKSTRVTCGGAREGLLDRLALAGLRQERDVVRRLVPHRWRAGRSASVVAATAGSGS